MEIDFKKFIEIDKNEININNELKYPEINKKKDIGDNILNKSVAIYKNRSTLNHDGIIANIKSSQNKSRYNFPEKPKTRQYTARTEIYSINRSKYNNR